MARLALISGWLAFATTLHAEPTAADKATAQALFDQGKQLAASGKFSEACPKFEESQRLDPGVGTQFHLANCYEQAGRTASAWTLFLEVASASHAQGQLEREKVARARASSLQARLPKLTISVPDGSRTSGLEIKRDGVPVGPAQWGAPLPVDPGDHTITASAARKRSWQTAARLPPEGGSVTVSVPQLQDAPTETPPPLAAASPRSAPAEGPNASPRQSSARGTLGLVVGGAGVLVIGTGVVLGILAKAKFDSAQDHGYCDATGCEARGLEIRSEAVKRGNVATIVFSAGAVFTAGGLILWLTAPKSDAPRAAALSLTFAPSEVLLRGTF
ncbi:MAG TPA: hypothetical protein VF881_19325 [Polyangiaceae bacterium]